MRDMVAARAGLRMTAQPLPEPLNPQDRHEAGFNPVKGMTMIDPEMQEKAEPPSRAADGGPVPGACNTLGEFIRTVEDGQFDADCYVAIRDLNAKMAECAWRSDGKAKGKVTITLDFTRDGGITEIKSAFKVTPPSERRAKSHLWLTEDNRFTRTQPGQRQLFGIVDVAVASSTPVRKI